MNSELYIESQRVDISAELSNLLTFAIDDVKDFASRQTTFSKTIILPGTNNNNKLFGGIFETGGSNVYNSADTNIGYNFNPSKAATCVLFQDFMQTFKGTMRMLQVNKDNGRVEYEVALNGELTGLNVALSNAFLHALDFSDYDHVYNTANIIASWDNPGATGYYYPLMDYGNYSTLKHDWQLKTFRPALYVKEFLDKMFSNASYRYECDLFETTRFKKLTIPNNTKDLRYQSTNIANGSGFVTTGPSGSPYELTQGEPPHTVEFTSVVSSVFTGDFEITYIDTPTVSLLLKWEITGTYGSADNEVWAFIRINGVEVPGTRLVLNADSLGTDFIYSNEEHYPNGILLTFTTGDILEFVFYAPPFVGAATGHVTLTGASFNITSQYPILVPVQLGDTVLVNDTLPKNIRQIDFLTSIVKLFNLYVYEDRFDERLIKISPFVDFYSTDSSNAVDWTYKLNRSKMVTIKPMSELNSKAYEFKYKDDSDYWNDQYKKRYNQGYGSYIFDSQFEFASQKNSLELIFAGTPLVGYTSEDKIYSTIFKKSGIVEEAVDSVIRILQTKKVTGVSSWDIKNGVATLATLTDYGYAGHFDDPDNPQNDLNFGVLEELFFTLVTGNLTVTQFNVYWSSYMAEITDKDSKMLTGFFYLTPKDIFDLDFSKYIYLDGVLFRLNKITDYNTTIPSDSQVQILKVIQTIY